MKRSYLVFNEEKKQGDKREKLTESLHLTVKIITFDLRKLRKAALNEKPTAMILHSQFKLAFQFRRKEDLLFKIKIKLIEMFN